MVSPWHLVGTSKDELSWRSAAAGLLFCEEGLDAEEAGQCGGFEGDCSPRCFEDLGDDSLSMSASTSDSQHSEGGHSAASCHGCWRT